MTRISSGNRQAGFSLIELAVVLVIVGLLIGGGIAALIATTEQTRRSEAKRQLEHVREALYGFAMSNGRLPCADIDSSGDTDFGRENFDGSGCESNAENGRLPWVTLGLGRRDPWGNPIYYAVTDSFAEDPASGSDSAFALSADGDLTVYPDDPATGVSPIADNVPAVVVSFGPQGDQVWGAGFNPCPGLTGFSGAEDENCDGDTDFVDAGYRTPDDSEGRFDDVVMWLPLPVLKSRMVDAGRLP